VSDVAGKTCGGQFSMSAHMSGGPQGRYAFRLNADRIELYDFWKGFTGKPAGLRLLQEPFPKRPQLG
jgi:hypothetical protein